MVEGAFEEGGSSSFSCCMRAQVLEQRGGQHPERVEPEGSGGRWFRSLAAVVWFVLCVCALLTRRPAATHDLGASGLSPAPPEAHHPRVWSRPSATKSAGKLDSNSSLGVGSGCGRAAVTTGQGEVCANPLRPSALHPMPVHRKHPGLSRSLVFKGVVQLAVGHGAALKPAVEHVVWGEGQHVGTARVGVGLCACTWVWCSRGDAGRRARPRGRTTHFNWNSLRVGHRRSAVPGRAARAGALTNAAQLALARGGGDGDVIDEVAVQVCHLAARQLLQLRDGAYHADLLAVLARPDGDRRAPEPAGTFRGAFVAAVGLLRHCLDGRRGCQRRREAASWPRPPSTASTRARGTRDAGRGAGRPQTTPHLLRETAQSCAPSSQLWKRFSLT